MPLQIVDTRQNFAESGQFSRLGRTESECENLAVFLPNVNIRRDIYYTILYDFTAPQSASPKKGLAVILYLGHQY